PHEQLAGAERIAQREFGGNRLLLRIGGKDAAEVSGERARRLGDELRAETGVTPLRVQQARRIAKVRIGGDADPNAHARKREDRLEGGTELTWVRLGRRAEDSECRGTRKLGHERLV